MGLKSLFSRKKKQHQSNSSSNQTITNISRSSSSVHSRAQIEEELEQVFNKFDVNGDGKISASELGSMMASLGNQTSDEELQSMIREVDSDGDGFIDLREFIELNTKDVEYNEVLENVKDAFQVFDVDNNGSITAEELRDVLKNLGEECTLAECRKMISGVDTDGNGVINFDEFKVMMMNGFANANANAN